MDKLGVHVKLGRFFASCHRFICFELFLAQRPQSIHTSFWSSQDASPCTGERWNGVARSIVLLSQHRRPAGELSSMFYRVTEGASSRFWCLCTFFLGHVNLVVAEICRRSFFKIYIEAHLERFPVHIRVPLPASNHLGCSFDDDTRPRYFIFPQQPQHTRASFNSVSNPNSIPCIGSKRRENCPTVKFGGAKNREKFGKAGTETNRRGQGYPRACGRVQGNGHPDGLREVRFSSMV